MDDFAAFVGFRWASNSVRIIFAIFHCNGPVVPVSFHIIISGAWASLYLRGFYFPHKNLSKEVSNFQFS